MSPVISLIRRSDPHRTPIGIVDILEDILDYLPPFFLGNQDLVGLLFWPGHS